MKRSRHHRIPPHQWMMGWFAASALALLAAPALIAESPQEEPATESPSSGLRAYLDPETGELTDAPSGEQIADLSKGIERTLSRSTVGIEPFALARGGRGVYLDHRFQSALIARVQADGNLEISSLEIPTVELSCVHDPQAATRLLEAGEVAAGGHTITEWVEK